MEKVTGKSLTVKLHIYEQSRKTYLVDTSQGSYVDGLSSHSTGTSDTSGIFTWTTVDYCVHKHLNWVLEQQTVVNNH